MLEKRYSRALNPLSLAQQAQDSSNKKIYKFKIIVLGASKVGKSSIIYQYTDKKCPDYQQSTIGIDFGVKILHIGSVQIHLQLWDTAGLDGYSLPKNFYQGAIAALLIYDITNKKSFDMLQSYWNQIVNRGQPNKQVYLIGNKLDIKSKRQVPQTDGVMFSGKRRIKFYQLSSYDYIGIDQMFDNLITAILTKIQDGVINQDLLLFGGNKGIKLKKRQLYQQRRYNKCC